MITLAISRRPFGGRLNRLRHYLKLKLYYQRPMIEFRRRMSRKPLASSARYAWFGSPEVGPATVLLASYYDGELSPFALKQAQVWKECGYSVNIIVASDVEFVPDCPFPVMLRENKGYDFGSWAHAISLLDLTSCSRLVLVNDSFVPGPQFSCLIAMAENFPHDAVGVTESVELRRHVQSYFMMFKNNSHRPGKWRRIKSFERRDVIDCYEIMVSDDFGIHALFPAMPGVANPTMEGWREFERFFKKRKVPASQITPLDNSLQFSTN